MSLESFLKVLGSFGSDCETGLLELLLLELLFELFPLVLVLFLLETDTPTPTPMAMMAKTAMRAPITCGNGVSQSAYPNHRTSKDSLARRQGVSPTTDPLLDGANKDKGGKGNEPRTLTCDCPTAASLTTPKAAPQ